jgi:hypothetical protein
LPSPSPLYLRGGRWKAVFQRRSLFKKKPSEKSEKKEAENMSEETKQEKKPEWWESEAEPMGWKVTEEEMDLALKKLWGGLDW